jgi:1-pyrroline-5-carboxylate dehydrogenase
VLGGVARRTCQARCGRAGLRDRLAATTDALTYGDVADFGNFAARSSDRRAFDKHAAALDGSRTPDSCT